MSLIDSRDKKKVSIKIAGITELQQTILGSGRYFILTKNMLCLSGSKRYNLVQKAWSVVKYRDYIGGFSSTVSTNKYLVHKWTYQCLLEIQ